MWSLGCVIAFYMRQGEHVFEKKEEVTSYKLGHATSKIFNPVMASQYSKHLLDLVYNLVQVVKTLCTDLGFQVVVEERPSAEDILSEVTPERQESGKH